jgi:hypothetical protein
MYYRTKIKSEAGSPHVIDSANLLHDTQVKVALVAKAAAFTSYTKAVQGQTWSIHKQNVCSFSNIISHQNHLLLFVKHLTMNILTRKYQIRQQ